MKSRLFTFFRLIILLGLIQSATTFFAYSQYGNEWINSNQKYYKISVGETGLYVIPFNELRAIGIGVSPLGTVQSSELQLYHRGIEQAILIRNDSLFFYGEKNDGTLDSMLYNPSSVQSNKNTNLYSDTTAYFITWVTGVTGKRMPVESLVSSASLETYHLEKKIVNFFDKYNSGYLYSSETYTTMGDIGEGWTSNTITTPNPMTLSLQCPNVNIAGPKAELFVRIVGENGNPVISSHVLQITIQGGGKPDTSMIVPAFAYLNTRDVTFKFPASYLSTGAVTVVIRNLNASSKACLFYYTLTYPQTFQFSGTNSKVFNISDFNSISAIQFTNATPGLLLMNITNSNSIKLVEYKYSGGTISAAVMGGSKLLAVPAVSYLKPGLIKAVAMPVYSNLATSDYVIITHKKIINAVHKYAGYRASQKGGGFDTLVVEVNDLYNLFSYGEKSPVAIRRFLTYLNDNGKPHYIFIMGKGLDINYNVTGLYTVGPLYRLEPGFYINNTDPAVNREDLIPSYGYPGSDLAYVAGLGGMAKDVPGIAIGRYAAQNEKDVENYLIKIDEHESTPNAVWRKNFLHLSGGSTQGEKDDFLTYVNTLKVIAEDTIYSGKVVRTISKKGSGSIDNTLQTSIADVVNSGVSHITSFGHTTPDFTDIDFGFASMDFYGYSNQGKYPLLYTNGCYSGQIFGWTSFAEDWVKTPGRGAIASIGHTHVGYVNLLKTYTTQFYRGSYDSREMIGQPVGDLQLRTIKSLGKSLQAQQDTTLIATIQQMTLHGDPAVKIYMPTAPDLVIDNSRVSIKSFDGRPVTAISDSFALQLIVDNPGLDYNDSLQIKVVRVINGKVITYGPLKFRPVKYSDTVLFVIKSPDVSTFGENSFEVYLDPNNLIPELDDINNNHAVLNYFIPISGVVALYPTEFSIVNKNPVTFIAQSTNILTEEKDYYIEIDTTYLFNSFLKLNTTLRATSLIKWNNVSLPYLKDSTVYYWRVRYKDIPMTDDTLWGESSFIYIKDSPEGWSQSEFPQFFKDETSQINRNISQRDWAFSKNQTKVSVTTVGSSYNNFSSPYIYTASMETAVSIYGMVYKFRDFCDSNGVIAVAFNRITGKPYTLNYGSKCEGVPGKENSLNVFTHLSNTGNQNQLEQYISAIPNGDAVLLVSTGQADFGSWGPSLKSIIKTSLASDSITNLTDGRPFILLSVKGATKPLKELSIPDSETGMIVMDDTIQSTNRSGFITSTLIGPATSWGYFYHDVITSGSANSDQDSLMIIGVDINGKNVDTIAISQRDSLDLSQIGQLNNYTYLRLLAQISDSVDLTPAYLRKWQVIYSGVPEGTMLADKFEADTYKAFSRQEGDSVKICYAFENISNYSFPDTLQARITITNSNKGPKTEWMKLGRLKSDSTITFCYILNTSGLVGNNILQMYVNPLIQKEQYYTNNLIEVPFTVIKDQTNPVLDVVFDGVHIMNGDIVSPSPMITITLNDENKFQIRQDKTGIEVYLKYPGQTVPIKIDPNEYTGMQIGKNGKNSFLIEYNPTQLANGRYTLLVRASDVSGNTSGTQDYAIEFEVINESTITNFYPYPNPFSSNTRFVFTVTGNEVPKDIIIQIMTITGKVVREITEQEIGPIRIGNNKTDYAWDGTDEFGDRLANGVYLYRVLIKNGDTFKHRDTAGDKAFKKDWGKLYILR